MDIVTYALCKKRINEVVADAPEMFDTLKEVAEWIGTPQTGGAALQIKENTEHIGDMDTLDVEDTDNLTDAVNKVDDKADENAKNIGNINDLNVDEMENLVDAINRTNTKAEENKYNIGSMVDLEVDDVDTLVQAINVVQNKADTNTTNIGTISDLDVDEMENLVDAVNRVNAKAEENKYNIGSMVNLEVDGADNLVDAVNKVQDKAYAKYTKPSTGIPKDDLDSGVQTSLTKADNAVPSSEKGAASGVATLDSTGKVPSSQLPSYVDDVLEYNAKTSFPTKGESGKIYVDTSSNLTYRWSGSEYVEISKSLALGETSSTAYAGDKGKTLADNLSTHTSNTTVHITAAERTAWNGKMSGTVTHLSGDVPTTRKINNKALSSDITLTAADVGALASTTTIPTVTDTYSSTSSNAMSGKAVASAVSGILSTLYPVGSIYLSYDKGFNPKSILPGTWELIPDSYLRTGAPKSNGGSLTSGGTTLSDAQVPLRYHGHGFSLKADAFGSHNHNMYHNHYTFKKTGQYTSENGSHSHRLKAVADAGSGSKNRVVTWGDSAGSDKMSTNSDGAHQHTFTIPGLETNYSPTYTGDSGIHEHTISGSIDGSGVAATEAHTHSIEPTYTCVYAWRRTA